MAKSVADAVAKKLADYAKKMSGSVEVGFMENATYPDGTPVAAVAFWNEYGNGSAPPRPFFRNMIDEEKPTWPGKVAALAKATDNDGPKVLALMGEDIQGALIQSINNLREPALSPYTIKKKGFDKPLIDTGHMINSTGYEVTK